jgi:hypothetical protein
METRDELVKAVKDDWVIWDAAEGAWDQADKAKDSKAAWRAFLILSKAAVLFFTADRALKAYDKEDI